jgi:hypothetical protein
MLNASIAGDGIALLQNYRLNKFDHRDAVDCSVCEAIPFIWSPIIGLCGAIFSAFYLFINWESDTGHQRLNSYMIAATFAWFVKFLFLCYFLHGPRSCLVTATVEAKHSNSLIEGFLYSSS